MPGKKTTQNNQTVNVDAALAMGQETVETSCKPARTPWI